MWMEHIYAHQLRYVQTPKARTESGIEPSVRRYEVGIAGLMLFEQNVPCEPHYALLLLIHSEHRRVQGLDA